MVAPLAVAYQFHSQFILGPALVIILAAMIGLIVKYPSSKNKVGGILVLIGFMEVLVTLPLAFFWGFLIGLATLIFGIVITGSKISGQAIDLFLKAKTVLILILVGIVGIAIGIITVAFPFFAFGLIMLILGVVIGGFYLSVVVKKLSLRAAIGTILIALAFGEILMVAPTAFTWGFIIGLTILASGIVMGAMALYPWTKMCLNQQRARTLRKGIFAILAIVVVSSALLIIVRSTTNLIHEQTLVTYHGSGKPNLTLQGVLTRIALNYEVNNGYSYHIFPAIISFNVSEFVWGSEFGQNKTSASEYWRQKNVAVFFEKSDVPKLNVGQLIEASGYWEPWLEDSLYSGAFVVAPQIDGSYVKLADPVAVSALNANLINTGYLKMPSLPTQDNGNSRLFLVSATSRYGVFNGQDCFIINATIRNDYSAQQLPPNSLEGYNESGNAYFIIMAKLYSQNVQINATEITEPYTMPVPGSPQHGLVADGTGWFELYLATPNKNVNRYDIDLVAVAGIPIP